MQQGIYFSHCSTVFQKGGRLVGQAVKMEKGTELLRPQLLSASAECCRTTNTRAPGAARRLTASPGRPRTARPPTERPRRLPRPGPARTLTAEKGPDWQHPSALAPVCRSVKPPPLSFPGNKLEDCL